MGRSNSLECRCLYPRPLSSQMISDFDRDAADLEQFVERDRRLAALFHDSKEGRHARTLPFILPPEVQLAETGPSVRSQLSEVVQLQDAPAREYFQPLFGE